MRGERVTGSRPKAPVCHHGRKYACKKCGIPTKKARLPGLQPSRPAVCPHGRKYACKKCGISKNKTRPPEPVARGGVCRHGRKRRCKKCGIHARSLSEEMQRCPHGFKTACQRCGIGQCENHPGTTKKSCMICRPREKIYRNLFRPYMRVLGVYSRDVLLKALGTDIPGFIRHMDAMMKPGMTWVNYGKAWHFDHVIPVARGSPSKEEGLQRLHYTNIRPTWKRAQTGGDMAGK
eukprot:jgi/Mesvir1/26089/Mv06809-RA.1